MKRGVLKWFSIRGDARSQRVVKSDWLLVVKECHSDVSMRQIRMGSEVVRSFWPPFDVKAFVWCLAGGIPRTMASASTNRAGLRGSMNDDALRGLLSCLFDG